MSPCPVYLRACRSAAFGAVLAGCSEAAVEPTQVIVLVGGDSAIDFLDVRVYDESGSVISSSRSIDLTRRVPARLPTSFTIVPAEGRVGGRFRMRIQGFTTDPLRGTFAQASYEVIAAFSPERSVMLPVVLSAACAEERCGCSEELPCDQTCSPASSAASGAHCTALPVYADLPSVLPGEEFKALKRGLGDCARGTLPGQDGACEDLDECAFYIDECQVTPRACVNRAPDERRYDCVCPPGYSGKGEGDDLCKLCTGESCPAAAREEAPR